MNEMPSLKLLTRIGLLAFLPFLSGCYSILVTDAAYNNRTKTKYNCSVSRIEKAVLTKDDRLCVSFEQEFGNSKPRRFTLTMPLAWFQTNLETLHLERDIRPDIGYAYLRRSAKLIQRNGRFPDASSCASVIPVKTVLTPRGFGMTEYKFSNFLLLSNANQTIYLTRESPVEFVYIDPSMGRSFTVVELSPTVVQRKRAYGYYLLLPLTVPVDAVLWPFQLMLLPFLGQ
jgi:hypothetical protein